ncbi:MAG: Sigma-54 dependent transcriptional regulator/response regulator [Myxococcaceae bacterium]|nr:Sigma-54 dependent transcriptional regulator/response regulator [Myxococcaceae bacterium]
MAATILVVDDERNIRRTLQMVLSGAGFDTIEAGSAEEALKLLETAEVDLAILDLKLPNMNGLEALSIIRSKAELARLPVIVISGHASVAEAVEAVQMGATDFFEKPLDRDRVLISVNNALQTSKLQREVERLRADSTQRYEMIGQSPVMRRLFAELEKVAPTRGRVLITGESGTGKELIARAIHLLSPRKDAAFVKVNCAAIPTELIESELFGYEKGAFTGAQSRKKGLFEQANGGTLFLDEIGDMSLDAQAKVLRALQSGEITRVGSEHTVLVDVRVLAATNRDLETAVSEGRFREDLYFRLSVVPVRSPSLRERRDDIPELALSFARVFSTENGVREKKIDPEVLDALSERSWPGNVRELRNVVERMVILSGDRVTLDDLPPEGRIRETPSPAERDSSPAQRTSGSVPPPASHASAADASYSGERLTLREFRDKAEADYITATLKAYDWNISRASVVLGVERTNLHKKMRALNIRREGGGPVE